MLKILKSTLECEESPSIFIQNLKTKHPELSEIKEDMIVLIIKNNTPIYFAYKQKKTYTPEQIDAHKAEVFELTRLSINNILNSNL